MAATTLFPLQYKRQDAVPIDQDITFASTAARIAYLTSPRRYAGMIVGDNEDERVYLLNTTRDAWIQIGLTGPTGPSGTSGYSGIQGSNGTSGYSGFLGPTGPTGPDLLYMNDQSGTTYTLQLSDKAQTLVRMNNIGAMTLTIPLFGTVALPIGTNILVQRLGAGTLTIDGAGGVTIQSGSSFTARAQYSVVGVVCTALNTWLLCGDLT